MIRQVRHPLVERDIIGVVDHIVRVTEGDFAAARRRLDEIDELLMSIGQNPTSGARLSGDLDGWLVRFGGAGRMLTVVFKPELKSDRLLIALVAFGGQDWMNMVQARNDFES